MPLLSVRDFPFCTPAGTLSRDHWIRITLDVLLSRITSLRDCVYFLVDTRVDKRQWTRAPQRARPIGELAMLSSWPRLSTTSRLVSHECRASTALKSFAPEIRRVSADTKPSR